MTVRFQNYAYKYVNNRGKHIFVPNQRGLEIGYELKRLIEETVEFGENFFHLMPGGHIRALHKLRENRYFARADLKNFFYSISKNRVGRALHEISLPKVGSFTKWSCVKNPFQSPSYSLPYGFVQSPVLATLVLSASPLGAYLKAIQTIVNVSVYMDDIALSSNDDKILNDCFEGLKHKIIESNFVINEEKTNTPSTNMILFNCDLELMKTSVSDERVAKFNSEPKSIFSKNAFERYCRAVSE